MKEIGQAIKGLIDAILAAKEIIHHAEQFPYFKYIALMGIPSSIVGIAKLIKKLRNHRRF